jgi:ankyrin repeat protein
MSIQPARLVSASEAGITPFIIALVENNLELAKYLVVKGANLFASISGGGIVMNLPEARHLLQYAKDLRFDSVKQLLFLSKTCKARAVVAIETNSDSDLAPPRRSARLEAPLRSARLENAVFGDPVLPRIIASYILRTELIVRDMSLPKKMSDAMTKACRKGDVREIAVLLILGEGINCANESGETPVSLALYAGHVEAAIALNQKGADLSMVNLQGANLLHQSVDGGSEAVKWVIETKQKCRSGGGESKRY